MQSFFPSVLGLTQFYFSSVVGLSKWIRVRRQTKNKEHAKNKENTYIFHSLKYIFSWEIKYNKYRQSFRLLVLKTKTNVSGSWEKILIKVQFFCSVTFKTCFWRISLNY